MLARRRARLPSRPGADTGAGLAGSRSLLRTRLPVRVAMGAVAFFGFFHGFAHGAEIPGIADPLQYAPGFLLGTILLHLLGVLIGDIAKRYKHGISVLRVAGAIAMALGILFIVEAL